MHEPLRFRKPFANTSEMLHDLRVGVAHYLSSPPGRGINLRRRCIMGNTAVIRMAHDGQGVTLAGQPMAFLVTGEHTKHTSMFDWTLPPHFSTGRHVHRVQEETFYVLEGQCEWQIGNETVRALPGTFVFIPPGVPHNI